MSDDTISDDPGTICPNCGSDNWVVKDPSEPRDLTCHACAESWTLANRGWLRELSRGFPCPGCGSTGGILRFEVASIPPVADTVVPSLDGTHQEVGKEYCGQTVYRWYNPPNDNPPQIRPVG